MDFELSDDQLALRDAARKLLDEQAAPGRVRAVVDRGGGYDSELWAAMVEQGWPALELDLGMGMVEAAVLLEEIGARTAPAPFLSAVLAVDVLPPDWIAPVVAGEAIATVAWDPSAPVLYGASADFVVCARREGVTAYDRRGRPRPAAEPAMDRTRELAWVDLDGVPAVEVGGEETVERLLARGAVAHAAEMLGGAARLLDITVAYAKERVQFGRPIGSFQAVKHRCADMLVDVEGMRSAVYYAAWALAAADAEAPLAASTAKVWCSDAARRVMASALQVHGGIGFTWEHDLHLFLKRSHLDQTSFGDATFHRARLARLLRRRLQQDA